MARGFGDEMPRADSIIRDPRWPRLAEELASTPQSSLSLPQLAAREGIQVHRLRAAVKAMGVERPPNPAPAAVLVTVELPEQDRAALVTVCARRGWRVLS
jgi:hypothetical protein